MTTGVRKAYILQYAADERNCVSTRQGTRALRREDRQYVVLRDGDHA